MAKKSCKFGYALSLFRRYMAEILPIRRIRYPINQLINSLFIIISHWKLVWPFISTCNESPLPISLLKLSPEEKNENANDWIVFYAVSAIFQPYNAGWKCEKFTDRRTSDNRWLEKLIWAFSYMWHSRKKTPLSLTNSIIVLTKRIALPLFSIYYQSYDYSWLDVGFWRTLSYAYI